MIPKIIHFVWCGGGKKSELFYRCLESWKKFCPDYKIMEWNEDNFDISASLYSSQAYSKKKFGFVPDYIRAKVLYDYGGIYVDTDVEITKSFDDLLENDFLISFENGAYLETAVLGSIPHHPFLKKMCDFYTDHPYIKANGKLDLTPSTPIWTSFLMKYYGLKPKAENQKLHDLENQNLPSVTVFNSDYFCPINYTTKELKTTENTYAIHYFDASWFSKKLKTREKFLKGIYKVFGKNMFAFFTRRYLYSVYKRLKKDFEKIDNKN